MKLLSITVLTFVLSVKGPAAASAYEGYMDFIFDGGVAYDRNGGLFLGDSPDDGLYPLNGLLAGSSVFLDHPAAARWMSSTL